MESRDDQFEHCLRQFSDQQVITPQLNEKMRSGDFVLCSFWTVKSHCCIEMFYCKHWHDLLTILSESNTIKAINLKTDKPLVYMQTNGNRIYKDLRNYINAVRGESAFNL